MKQRYLRVKNWSEFQHYKDRRPIWIKLHVALVDDYEVTRLPDAAKYHLIGIWLLAAKTDNKIPDDPKWVGDKIGANGPVNLKELEEAGFLIPWNRAGKKAGWASRYIAAELRAAILERDSSQCQHCSRTDNLEIDHIVPVSRGGTSTADNLQVLCRACNRAKRVRLPAEQVATQTAGSAEPRVRDRVETEKENKDPSAIDSSSGLSVWEGPIRPKPLGAGRDEAFALLLSRVTGGDNATPKVLWNFCRKLPQERIEAVAAKFEKRCVNAGVAVNALKSEIVEFDREIRSGAAEIRQGVAG